MDIYVDYYQLLHVQPSAPGPVIKASYRAMMQKLKHHPDKGGDVEFAKLLNDAANTLCNPDTRAQYDALRKEIGGKTSSADNKRAEQKDNSSWGEPGGSPAGTSERPKSSAQDDVQALLPSASQCPFCLTAYASDSSAYSPALAYNNVRRCRKCNGATTPIKQMSMTDDDELRRLHRQKFKTDAQLWLSWPQAENFTATITDFSPEGCAMSTDTSLDIEQLVMIETTLFNAICRVRHCKNMGPDRWINGLSFITLDMHSRPGTLLSATV